VALVHRHAAEAALPEVAGALQPGVDMAGVSTVDRGQGPAQGVRVGRDQDQVHMVGHKDPGPDLDPCGGSMLGQQVAIEAVVVIAEESLGAAIAPLGDVVRDAGEDRAGEAGHGQP
jgi:hypothetical protein